MTDPGASNQGDDSESAIRLTKRDVKDAARLLKIITGDTDDLSVLLNGPVAEGIDRRGLVERARAVVASRHLRSQFFNRSIFGEPAWDLLLVLYVADAADARQTIGKLADAISLPPTTALRWFGYLEKEGLVGRVPHPTDRRVTFIQLLEKGRRALDAYFETVPVF